MKRIRVLYITALGMLIGLGAVGALTAQTISDLSVGTQEGLRVPDGYRATYEYLGAWSVAADQPGQGAQQLHEVYVSPGAVPAYLKDGDFPDGTVLVKEVYGTATTSMTTGQVSRAGELKGWFVMVRDAKNTHPGNKLWGDGWGWSWFDAGNPTKTTSTDYQADCKGCHLPAQATNWIYVEGYARLRR